jgi:hypothetical protein
VKALAAFLVAGAVVGMGIGAFARRRDGRTLAHSPSKAAVVLEVPRTTANIEPDGELEDWPQEQDARTTFHDATGAAARPHSDARFVWRDGTLYAVLYAADQDVRTTGASRDAFRISFQTSRGERSLEVPPAGPVIGDLAASVRLGRDVDGTIDDASGEDDEEWLAEMAVPLSELGLTGKPGERVWFAIERCDTPRDGRRRCGASVANELVLVDRK